MRTLRTVVENSFAMAVGVLVLNAGAATLVVAQSPPVQWKLTPTIAVGDGSNTIELERVRSVQLLRDGRVLISDGGAKTIFVVDEAGRPQRPIGRTGQGPAEYGSPGTLATIGDTIAVLDVGNTRIGLFNGKGEWQGQWPSQRISGDGVRLFRTQLGEFYNYSTRPDGKILRTAYIRYDKAGARDTVLPEILPPSETGTRCEGPNQGGFSFFTSKFEPARIRIPGAGSTVLDGVNDTYKLVLHKPNGPALVTYSGTAVRVPLTDAEWENSIAGFTEFATKNTTAACTRKTLNRPSSKPAIRTVWWDDAGRLWVERYLAKGFAFDVFDKRGVQIATMAAPDRNDSVEPNVVGNRIAMLTTNDDSAPVVRVYKISGVK